MTEEGQTLKVFNLSEYCFRLRRNLIIAATLILVIVYYDIGVSEVKTSGVSLSNLTSVNILKILVGIMIYHVFAFTIRVVEEFKEWRITFVNYKTTLMTGPGTTLIVDLARTLEKARLILEKIYNEGRGVGGEQGPVDIARGGNIELTAVEVGKLKDVVKYAEQYGKGLGNFAKIHRYRIFVWDIGVPAFLSATALLCWATKFCL